MRPQTRLLVFFATTSMGSALSTVATFLSIEPRFGTPEAAALVLAVKPAANIVTSFLAPLVLRRMGAKGALALSQAIGLVALAILSLGFWQDSLPVIMGGVIAAGIPSTLLGIVVIASLKVLTVEPTEFRRDSGNRDLIAGLGLFVAGLAAPLLLPLGIHAVFAIDACTFLAALIGLNALSFGAVAPNVAVGSRPSFAGLPRDPATRRFVTFAAAPLLLISLLPMMASSTALPFTKGMPLQWRESLWSLEAVAGMTAGFVYPRISVLLDRPRILALVSLTAFWLVIACLPAPVAVAMGAAFAVGLTANLAFARLRDDYLIGAQANPGLVHLRSSLAMMHRQIMCGLSPLLVVWAFKGMAPWLAALTIGGIQVALIGLSNLANVQERALT